jgi:hypothetical protein
MLGAGIVTACAINGFLAPFRNMVWTIKTLVFKESSTWHSICLYPEITGQASLVCETMKTYCEKWRER